jgi:hypothetical protein
MDLRIRKQKTALTAKELSSKNATEQDPDLMVTPITREQLIEQLDEAYEDIIQGRVYTTEEVIAYLKRNDD